MSELKVWYDGIELTQWLKVTMGKDEMLLPERIDDAISPGNRSGYELRSVKFGKRTIEMPFIISGDLRSKMAQIAQLLHTTETKKLIFSDRPERYYMAIPEGEIELPEKDVVDLTGTIKWICYDPYAYSVREDEFTFNDEEQQINVTTNYQGKLYGDLGSNPNIIYKSTDYRSLDLLSWELDQEQYFNVGEKDGIGAYYNSNIINDTCRLIFKFNVFESINRSQPNFWQKYGITDYTDKLQWLRDHMDSLTFNCWSYGRGSQGYLAYIQYWDGEEWTGTQKNSASVPTLNSYTFDKSRAVDFIDSNGYIYFMTIATPASESIPTSIYADYVELQLALALPVSDSINIVNEGPLPVPVRFEITNHEDNGFIGITDDSESILLGSVGQIDTMDNKKSERLFTTNQDNDIGLSQWTINDGVVNDYNPNHPTIQSGNFEDPSVIREPRWRLRNKQQDMVEAWGPGSPSGIGWHGPSASVTFPADSDGAFGAQNFSARFYVQSLFGDMSESGIQNCNLWGPNKELIISVEQWKDVNAHNSMQIRIGNQWAFRDLNNQRWDNFLGSILIKRFGNTYTISLENSEGNGPKTQQTITYTDPTSAKILCTGMTYWKARWGNTTSYNNVMWNDLYDFWFQKDNVDKFVDIPNTFAEGDVIDINDNEYKVETTVNGTQMLILQNIASKPIIANPGNNIVNFLYSDFARRPDVKAYIRKKYL